MNTTASPKRTNKKDKSGVVIKLCIIGAGKMGTTRIDVTNKSAKLQCIAVVETDKTNSVWSNPPVGSDGHAIDVFADLSEVKERIDAVCICTPTKTHADLITQAVERKVKFIFCEAPIAWSEDEVRACYKMCKEHGVFLFCGWYRRFDPDFTSLFDLYQGSHLVSVKFVDKLCCKFTLHRKAEKKAQSALEKANSTPVMLHSDSLLSHCDSSITSSMCNINESLTSSLSQNDSTVTSSQSLSSDVPETTTPKQLDLFRECLAHDINLALMFMNDQAPVSVQVIARDTFGTGSYDNAYCNLEYPGGKSLLIELSKYSKRYENSIRLVADGQVVVCGKKNIIFLEPSESRHSNDTQEDLTTDDEEEEEEDEDDDDNEEEKKEETKTATENDNTNTTTKSDENISEKDNSLINSKTSVKSSSKQRHYDSERYADAMARQMDHFAEICRKDKVPVRYGTDACTLTAQIVQLAEKSVILGSKVFFSEGPVMKILQAGTCGTAQYVHDNVLARLPQCKALATYPNPPSEENEGVEGAEVLPADLRKAIETPEINGVYVCLPPKSKIACVQACLGLRKKVLCQTPVTDFFALQQLAAQKDSFFMIDFPRRFDKKLLRAKEKVTQIEVEGGMFESLAIEDRDPELADNAPEAIWGSVVHDVDLLSWLLENVDCEITVESAGPGPEPHSLVVVFVVWLQRYDRTVKATIHHVAGSDVFVNTVTVNGDVFGHDARKKKLRYSLSAYYDDAYACMFKSFAKRPVNAPGQGLFCRTYARTFKLVEGILDILVDDADMYVSGDASSDVANAVVAAATRTPLATPVIAIADSASSSSLFGNVTITTTTVPTAAASSEPMGKVSCDGFELGTSTEDYDDDSDTDTDTDSDTDGEGNNGSNSSEIVLNISKTPEALSNGGVDEHLPVLNLQAIEKHKSVTPTMSPTKESSATPVEEDDGIIVAKLWGADDSKSAAGEPPSPQAGFLSTPKMVPQQQQAQQAQQQQQQAQPIAPSPRRQRNGGIRRKKSSKQGSPSPAGSISGSISGAGVIRKEGVVYKPAVYDENALSVYEHIREHIPGLMRFVPRVTGRIVVAGSPCIAVEDLAQQYKRPAYLDLKLGEPGDFMRIHRQPYSMRVTRHSGLKGTDALPVNKHQQSWNDLVMYFRDFLRDGRTGCTRYDVIPSLIEQLREIYDVFESQTSLRMRAASLRFIYEVSESDDPSPPTVRLVDLARVKILGEASKDEESGESPAGAGNGGGGDDEDVSLPVYASVDDVDHFFCFGILNAINLLNSIRDEFVTRNALFLCRDDLSRHQRPKFRTADEQATFIANRLANENVSVVVSQPGSTAVSISRKVAELLGVKYIVLRQLSLLCDPSTSKVDEPKEEEEEEVVVDDDPLFDRETSAAVAAGMEGLSAGESFISLQKAVVPAFIKVCGKYTRLAVVGDEAVLKSLLSILVGHKWKTHLKFKSILSLVPSTTSALGWIIERINVPNPFFHKSKIEKS